MCLTEQRTKKLTKKELMRLLEPYGDDALIYIGVELKQGYVGFVDGEEDKNIKDKYMFVLKSDALNDWYKGDIMELGGEFDE